ncbi:DUF4112 domain-containing protein [Halomarina oriensis]|uniref:DUF4112 domain-containing protein n=1 Tax=Halomarina oriensis TaxID=671145 RepID=A0A6B0GEQ6_9EURY|nr:DUF4112 domain-containing protein [Halomarina oriensis]MWG33292.1 DUF4112 domain-containing protein [Halomarina oriensis]
MDDAPHEDDDGTADDDTLPGEDALNEIGDDDFDVPDSVDEDALNRMRAVADLLDEAVTIPGTDVKVGLDPLVSAIPAVGPVVSAGVSLYIVLEAANLGVPFTTVVRMLANVTVDVATGSIPVVGPIFDTFWKTNAWNVDLVEEFLESERARDRERRAFAPDPRHAETVEESTGDEDEDDGPIRIDVTE